MELSQISGIEKSDFRAILREEFEKKCLKNPRYTMGSFSNFLGITPSRLHDIFKGRYGISLPVANGIANRLKFSDEKKQFFCDLVESRHGRGELKRRLAKLRLAEFHFQSQFRKVSLDAFKATSDWYHFAILELTYIKGFRSCTHWISGQLGIKESLAKEAICRLKRLGLLVEESGELRSTSDYSSVGDEVPSSAIKKYHLQLMEKAQLALFHQPIDKREFASLTMAIDSEKLAKAKEMISDFQKEFCREMDAPETSDSIYCLSMQFFNLISEQR